MNFNRRRFLTDGGLTLGLGGAFAAEVRAASLPAAAAQPLSDYERIFAKSEYLSALGLPRSWESVGHGFHPFSPDRIGILPGMPLENWLTALVQGEQFYGLLSFFDEVKWLLSLQFKWANTRRVVNPPVDWWLFLLREPLSSETF